MVHFDAVMFNRALDRLPPLRFDGAARARAAIVLCGHLGQDAVAQTERGIPKPGEMAALEQFGINHCAGVDDFGAPGADAGDLHSLLEGQAGDELDDPAHAFSRHFGSGLFLSRTGEMGGDARQRGRCTRSGDHCSDAGSADSVLNARHFSRDQPTQAL